MTSFQLDTVVAAAAEAAPLKHVWLVLPMVQVDLGLARVIDITRTAGVPMLGLRQNMLTADIVATVRAAGLGIGGWACNDALRDRAAARALDVDVFTADRPDLLSVTKGVVGLLYGIALADGRVPAPDAKLYAQFPEYADLATQPGRDRLTIAHVLSMTMGLEWDELSIPYEDPRNSETAMDAAADRYRYILSASPREVVYCGCRATALFRLFLSHRLILALLLEYARRTLFEPMGFGPADWAQDKDGEPFAASGLRLLPRDMVKSWPACCSPAGDWLGRRLVPEAWVKKITTPTVGINQYRSYGYHWYMGDVVPSGGSQPHHWIGGIGWVKRNGLFRRWRF